MNPSSAESRRGPHIPKWVAVTACALLGLGLGLVSLETYGQIQAGLISADAMLGVGLTSILSATSFMLAGAIAVGPNTPSR